MLRAGPRTISPVLLSKTAKIALKVAAVPLEACDVHQGAVDGAEVEATYENTKSLLTDLDAHDTNIDGDLTNHNTALTNHNTALTNHNTALTNHDINIDGDLKAHDTNIDTDLAQHDTDIKALLANVQAGVDANGARLDILLARQLEVLRLLHTPEGRRATDVPACDGEDCVWPDSR